MNAISSCLDVLIPVVCGDDNINGAATFSDKELPFAGFDFSNGLIDRLLPATAVSVLATDIFDPLMRIHSVSFVDATDAYAFGHSGPFQKWGRLDDMGESGVIVLLVTDQSLPSAPS